ncbi:MAG: protein kinase, partial [Planctomycetales bacterium]|nr:protein kinase [Planctomycetales bacterium]
MKSQTIGDYDIVHALGQGAAGAVYLVRNRISGMEYAMKLLHPEEAGKARMNDRFIREALVLKDLRHPNIVGYVDSGHVDCGDEGISYYIVMELVECGSLKSAMRNFGRFPWRTAVKVAGQISEGLAHAHAKGVIHRDLKPA